MTDPIHCFAPISSVKVDDIDATLHLFSHPTGARLIYSEREDSNKTFAIAFPTVPTDDTGVFHILEHSVLCGSERYPLKDPFSEMLKSSLKTFLNAFTYPDKTVYPASTRCDKDFYNLIDVYMDSVFNPLVKHDPRIFRQEGWRYEVSEEGIERSGVVYSEMQGAYSSPDELGMAAIAKQLYSEGSYGYDSGGNPEKIPDLTYEALVSAHKNCYHPSNAYIFIDGIMDLDTVLSHINDGLRLKDCDRTAPGKIVLGRVQTRPATVEFPAEEGSGQKSKVVIGFRGLPFHKKNDIIAASVTAAALTSGNDAPLKRGMLDGGYCENLLLYTREESLESSVIAELRGVTPGCEAAARDAFLSLLPQVLDEGLDQNQIEAELSSMEFSARERDFGSYPKGLVYATSVLDSWIYGGAPELYLSYEESFRWLKEQSVDYFTSLFRSLTCGDCATVYLTPSSRLAQKRCDAEEEKINDLLKSGKLDPEQIAKEAEELAVWQDTPDSDEALSTLPSLSVADVPASPRRLPTEVSELDGVTVMAHPISTNGIVYAELFFDISDISKDDLFKLSTLAAAFGEVGTSMSDANGLRVRIKKSLGSLTVSSWQTRSENGAKLYLVVKASFLRSKADSLAQLLPEVLYTSDFNDKLAIKRRFVQIKELLKQRITSGSHSVAITRSGAKLSAMGALTEEMMGINAYLKMKEYDADPDGFIDRICLWMEEARSKFFTKERLTLGITANADSLTEELCKCIIDYIRSGEGCGCQTVDISPLPAVNELILSHATVGHTVFAANRADTSDNPFPEGAFAVTGSILDYELLWNEVRVKGGAYGTGFIHRRAPGTVGYYSYRDPATERSADLFPSVGGLLRDLAREDIDLEKYIIGTVGDSDPLSSPSQDGSLASCYCLAGRTYEDLVLEREEMLSFGRSDLLRIADELDELAENAVLTVIADKKARERLGNRIDTVIEA